MPTVVIHPGATVLVTGANGLIGSHIVDQLLRRGYNVRGTVRDVEKNKWLAEYFDCRYDSASFELVEVPDMTVEGCYDHVVDGINAFIHVASPLGGFSDVATAISIGVSAGLNALNACARIPSIKRFVFTSSSLATSFPKLNVEFSINESSYNEEAMEILKKEPNKQGLYIYAAMKTETEKAMWKWMEENKPGFVFNAVLPSVNFGTVLIPKHQGFPSTIDWARAAWTGDNLSLTTQIVSPHWFISPVDTALLHVSPLIYSDIQSERLFGFAAQYNFNQMLAIYRKLYPERKFPEDIEGLGVDRTSVPNLRAEEVLRWVKGAGWDDLEKSLGEMSVDWS
ncbi:dihydroflavonol-4-reductase [Clathrospora elynae]|uniref:Dihydroflavonol-4-reductase n=1 Tax=Clathrospora elynae TaxID=706981 RepID=A0A6A5T6R6_9PLEO|nr:dihydroflavonol-4-reductase [Clathrospora elynae]